MKWRGCLKALREACLGVSLDEHCARLEARTTISATSTADSFSSCESTPREPRPGGGGDGPRLPAQHLRAALLEDERLEHVHIFLRHGALSAGQRTAVARGVPPRRAAVP